MSDTLSDRTQFVDVDIFLSQGLRSMAGYLNKHLNTIKTDGLTQFGLQIVMT